MPTVERIRRFLAPCRWGFLPHRDYGFSRPVRASMGEPYEAISQACTVWFVACGRCGREIQ